jgi:aspartate-semialdehyde dehydrogenase
MKKATVAVVGATGLVGSTILSALASRSFPVKRLIPLASERSAGSTIDFAGTPHTVENLATCTFEGVDIALFAAGGSVSRQYAPKAASAGALVVDNSSAFRQQPDIPLVVPEVNADDITITGIIANPNCSTIQCMIPLKVLQRYGLKRIVFSTYQSVSGSGLNGLKDLDEGLQAFYPHPIRGNILPHIDSFLPDGYTGEEMKMINETRKILHEPHLPITATTARVPVRFGHCVSANVELEQPFDIDTLKQAFAAQEGLVLEDDPAHNLYPMPLTAAGRDEVFVGRVRRDHSVASGVNLWIVADNIRKGAAINAVQIAERAWALQQ